MQCAQLDSPFEMNITDIDFFLNLFYRTNSDKLYVYVSDNQYAERIFYLHVFVKFYFYITKIKKDRMFFFIYSKKKQ